jgi:hypothetical protein
MLPKKDQVWVDSYGNQVRVIEPIDPETAKVEVIAVDDSGMYEVGETIDMLTLCGQYAKIPFYPLNIENKLMAHFMELEEGQTFTDGTFVYQKVIFPNTGKNCVRLTQFDPVQCFLDVTQRIGEYVYVQVTNHWRGLPRQRMYE